MKEYRVRFNKKPGGPDDEAYFIELEDETGKSIGGPGTPYVWKDEGDSVVLVLPTYLVFPHRLEERDRLLEMVNEFMIRTSGKRMMFTYGFLEPHDVSELRRMYDFQWNKRLHK